MKLLKVSLALLNIVVTAIFLYFTKHMTIGFVGFAFFIYIISSSVHLLVHEIGHLFGGHISGYKLLCFQIGPLCVVSDNSKITIKWKKSISGQCIMYPEHKNHLHFLSYNLGGVIANFIVLVLSSSLLLFHSFATTLLFVEVVLVGLKKISINLIPGNTGSGPNDGYIVMLLKRGNAVQKDYAMYLRLYSDLYLRRTVSLEEYTYEREISKQTDEMLYYNEIQCLLASVHTKNTYGN